MKENVMSAIADKILSISLDHPVRIGISGVDGSGKTVFAKNLVDLLKLKTDREVIAATIDRFHNPRTYRYQKGRDSAEGFYHDSFQYEVLRDELLVPLGRTGDRMYRNEVFDHRTDSAVHADKQTAANDAILILEGIFIFRPEIVSELDYKIYINVPFNVTLQRMLDRDKALFSSSDEEIELFNKRYKAGQELYMVEVRPKQISDLVIDNTDFNEPAIVTGP